MEITKGVHLIPGTTANSYLIIEPSGLILIDTGLPGSARKILGYISSLGYPPEKLKHILITHADDDHYGSLARLVEITQAKSYTSAGEATAIESGKISRELRLSRILLFGYKFVHIFIKSKPSKIDQIIADGQTLPILGGMQVVGTPGHTPSHIAFYCPSQGILFAGDSFRSNGESLEVSSGRNTWDEMIAKESAIKLIELNPKIVCVGHGPVIYEAGNKIPEIHI